MKFRQVHLDFHTSEAINGIGKDFTRENFQRALKAGHVNHVNIFAKCHHGWAYFPSVENEMHPGLSFDLLGEMIDAAHQIGVETPAYISAGLDEKYAVKHPEYLIRGIANMDKEPDFSHAGYHAICFNTPYLDVLLRQIDEVTRKYDVDGLWLDIVAPRACVCPACKAQLLAEGKDPTNEDDVWALGEKLYATYTRRVRETVDAVKPGLPVFHNGGHIPRGRRDLMAMNSRQDLESLPTGGWGYDHFPLSARYVQPLGWDFVGMTGKFHTTWGEFGGFKHPNALRYEASLAVANGAKFNVGDQMHPYGKLDIATYRLIGEALSEVEAKEAYLDGVEAVADVALLSVQAYNAYRGSRDNGNLPDTGAARMLLEGHYLFDVVDCEVDLGKYKVVVLPDSVRLCGELQDKVRAYVAAGGQVLATGESGLLCDKDEFALDFGVLAEGVNPYRPDFFRANFDWPALDETAVIFYEQGIRLRPAGGEVMGWREDPFFNRTAEHFCSHQHTPNDFGKTTPGMVRGKDGVYLAWNVFTDYATKGSITLKWAVLQALDALLEGKKSLEIDMPAQGVTTVQYQRAENRYVHHLLYAVPVKRGTNIEVIEDIVPIYAIPCSLRIPSEPKQVYLVPSLEPLDYVYEGGAVSYVVPEVESHEMVVVEV